MKIFNFHLNKAGTKSLFKALDSLGFKGYHNTIKNKKINELIEDNFKNGKKAFDGFPRFDFICEVQKLDTRFVKMINEQYPDSKFILTYRNKEDRLMSLKNFRRVNNLPEYEDKHDDIIKFYEDYFRDKDNLLVLPVNAKNKWDLLCDFLKVDKPNVKYPFENRAKRGIVFLAGGKTYFINAYASARMLRKLGCNLPIEWFYLGDEMKPEWIRVVEEIPNTKCIDLGQLNKNNRKDNGGWQNKINAVLNSSFDEVLYLDADCFVWRNPEYLFETREFKETGALLWKDISDWKKEQNPVLKKYFGVEPQHQECCESGQLLFNKEKVMGALLKTKEYNANSKKYYEVVYGDKDTFYFGFLSTNTPFCFVPKRPSIGYKCLLQHDTSGEIVFSHMTGGKWGLNGRPFTVVESYPFIKDCSIILRELSEKLKGGIV